MSSTLKRKNDAGAANGDTKKPKVNANIMSFFGAPKTTPSSAKPGAAASASAAPEPTIKFDKEKWVAGLTPEQKKFLKLEIDTLDPSWLALLKDEITTKEFLELKKFLERESMAGKKIFPPREDVYSWSRHTPFHTVKCVILGQDPYHNVNQAHGLAFSVRPPTPAPPSLRNMYIALKNDYPTFAAPPNKGGLLTPWADRGVLMLNTCLTVRAHEANSHANRGWEKFTQRVIDLVAQKRTRGVVFMAWGTPAGKRVVKVDQSRHLVLKSVHPSPLSAARGFFECGHFRKCNDWLVSRYGAGGEIDWDLDPVKAKKSLEENARIEDGGKGKEGQKEKEEVSDEGATTNDETTENTPEDKDNSGGSNGGTPVPVIAVGEVDVDGSGKDVEKSDILAKEGEEGAEGAVEK